MIEAGIADYEMPNWIGVLAPANTPQPIVSKLNSELVRIIKLSDVKERLLLEGMLPIGSSSQEFTAFVKSELTKWGKAVQMTGVKAN